MFSLVNELFGQPLPRRAVLHTTLAGVGALTFSAIQTRQAAAKTYSAHRRSLILLWQDGGPSHFETFDPKPNAPSEYRGELDAISTALPGISYCEVLPRLAALADKTTVIRSLHQSSSDHVVGSHNVLTGWENETDNGRSRYPDVSAVVARLRSLSEEESLTIGATTDPRLARGMRSNRTARSNARIAPMPRSVDIGSGLHRGGPAYLGPNDGPFQIAGDPSKPGFVIQNLDARMDRSRMQERALILQLLDRFQSSPAESSTDISFDSLSEFRRQALDLLSGGAASRAFDVSREPVEVHNRYGRHLAGQQCLLARRLVDSGVSVVAVRFSPDGRGDYDRTMIGWDDHAVHGNIFSIMRQRGPQFDQAVSALVEDLEQRGMRDDVLVVVVGEFGRTPRIHYHKGCPGREHWGPAGCALLYGGGLEMGQVIGSTNDKGEHPSDRPLKYQDLLATIYHSLGINPAFTFPNHVGRLVPLLPEGTAIHELARPSNRRDLISNQPQFPIASTVTQVDSGESIQWHDRTVSTEELVRLVDNRQLRNLEFNGSPLVDSQMEIVGRLHSLESLNLSGTRVTDEGILQLRELTRLRKLTFHGTGVTLAGVVQLFVKEQQRTVVEALAAMGLTRTNESGETIAIDLAGTSFGDQEMQELASLASLEELHLASTAITDRALVQLCHTPRLKRLFLARCNIGDTGLAHVAQLTELEALNLYGTRVTSAGLASLAGLIKLRTLLITDLKLSAAAVDNLKRRVPGLTVSDFTPSDV